ncbi:MAG: phosphate/phosphite/phosphonate ABC transporter substrate-binding protein [Paracoccaceae bacterium]
MYDLPERRAETDALWTAIAARLDAEGVAAPGRLDRGRELAAIWTDPALLLAQTCGYPFATVLNGRVRLVATPRYRAPGCAGARYRSAVVVRAGDPARRLADCEGYRPAVNDARSQSGHQALRAALAEARIGLGPAIGTGAHRASIEAVVAGGADLAAIDCVTFALLGDAAPGLVAGVRAIAWTSPTPGLPLVTASATDEATRAALGRALDAVAADPALAGVRAALRIVDFARPDAADYAVLAERARALDARGAPRLLLDQKS